MKKHTLFYLLLFPLIALTLLFPRMAEGAAFMEKHFPPVNLREKELIPTPSPTPEETPSPTPEEAPSPTPVPLSSFYTGIGAELAGYYDLVSIRTEEEEFSDELLARLRQLGMPMILELRVDGSGVLGIFDQAIALEVDADSMQVFFEGKTMPFFYLDGRLRIQDGSRYMLFERRT